MRELIISLTLSTGAFVRILPRIAIAVALAAVGIWVVQTVTVAAGFALPVFAVAIARPVSAAARNTKAVALTVLAIPIANQLSD